MRRKNQDIGAFTGAHSSADTLTGRLNKLYVHNEIIGRNWAAIITKMNINWIFTSRPEGFFPARDASPVDRRGTDLTSLPGSPGSIEVPISEADEPAHSKARCRVNGVGLLAIGRRSRTSTSLPSRPRTWSGCRSLSLPRAAGDKIELSAEWGRYVGRHQSHPFWSSPHPAAACRRWRIRGGLVPDGRDPVRRLGVEQIPLIDCVMPKTDKQ